LLSCPFALGAWPWSPQGLDFRAFLPLKSRTRETAVYTIFGAVTLLGFIIFEAFRFLDPVGPFGPSSSLTLFVTPRRNKRGVLEFFCRESGLTSQGSQLTPLMFVALSAVPDRSAIPTVLAYPFYRVGTVTLL
jgi:hypothetical protein